MSLNVIGLRNAFRLNEAMLRALIYASIIELVERQRHTAGGTRYQSFNLSGCKTSHALNVLLPAGER